MSEAGLSGKNAYALWLFTKHDFVPGTGVQGRSWGGARGGNCPPKFLPGPPSGSPKIRSLSIGLFLNVLHRPLTAPLVAKLAPPVAPPNENVWLRPCWRTSWSCRVWSCGNTTLMMMIKCT